jgi:hypothetical protein
MISGMFYRDSSTDTSIKNIFDTASYTQQAGNRNDDLPWLYTQPLQNIGGAKVCIVLGK